MQSIIKGQNERVTTQQRSSEALRSKKFVQGIGWAILAVTVMGVFVITNIMMLNSFMEQPGFGAQRDERQATGVGPLLRDMLKRRGFGRRRGKTAAAPTASEGNSTNSLESLHKAALQQAKESAKAAAIAAAAAKEAAANAAAEAPQEVAASQPADAKPAFASPEPAELKEDGPAGISGEPDTPPETNPPPEQVPAEEVLAELASEAAAEGASVEVATEVAAEAVAEGEEAAAAGGALRGSRALQGSATAEGADAAASVEGAGAA